MKRILLLVLLFSNVVFAQKAPDENRFTKVVLAEKLDEPMELTALKDGRVLFIERKGALKQYDPLTGQVKTLAMIPVNTKYTNSKGQKREAEEGLMGLRHDPNFEKNHWIYMYYADPAEPKHVLARWELNGETLVESSKKVIIEVPTQREECCHTGGGIIFDKKGNLFLSTGNNTSNSNSDGYGNLDERPGQQNWDDQRGAGSTNDLRGKILRIHPETDGSYTIPEGNLFSPLTPHGVPSDGGAKQQLKAPPSGAGGASTRPEIYTMGHRNPWRLSIDNKTGFIYWGEVGPDASIDSERGPRGYDEFNQAKGPGFFGWPYFIGDNKPYADWDFVTNKPKPDSKFDPAQPINDSPNNTGLRELPPAQKAFIWYPYGLSEEFPLVGSSGRSATGGPVFRKADFPEGSRVFPEYYEGKWLAVDFMRGWIMSITMDENGNYKSMERFLPNTDFPSAIDISFAPDGDLYLLEYGTAWFRGNDNAALVKVEYNGGNRPPKVVATADKTSGAVPFKVNFSAKNSIDSDGDAMTYKWVVKGRNGVKTFKASNPTVDFAQTGTYDATVTVKDAKGLESSQSFEIKAGNEPPMVAFNMKKGNKTFYFPNSSIDYDVKVEDKEDGSLENGKIKPEQVAVSIDYMPIGYDKIEASQNHRGVDAVVFSSIGQRLMDKSDCKSCHIVDKKSVGPSYLDVAKKYRGDAGAVANLTKKIINGGGGVWGEHSMAAHPQISVAEAQLILDYVLNIDIKREQKSLPTTGNFLTKIPEGQKDKGTFMVRAAYKDNGSKTMKSLATEEVIVLRNNVLNPEYADFDKSTQLTTSMTRTYYAVGNDSYIGYKNIDLTGVGEIEMSVQAQARVGAAGGLIEVRLDSPTGTLIGATEKIMPKEIQLMPVAVATPAQTGTTPAPARPRMTGGAKLKVNVPENSGQHDIYFVFKSETAKNTQIVMQISSIEFKNSLVN